MAGDGAIRVALSTASVWPEPISVAFELAAELGYDGVEVMVWGDAVSQDIAAVAALASRYRMPVFALHAPCLLITQRVWAADPAVRLDLAVRAAEELGADTVVVHPPFRWQRDYAMGFSEQVRALEASSGLMIAVENMFPLRRSRVEFSSYLPSPDPTDAGFPHYTLDLSHTSTAGADAMAMAARMGSRLSHLHLADGSGAPRDEHLVPGRGNQPCAEVCLALANRGFTGTVVLEISTRRAHNRPERRALLTEALLFARLHV
ncbi:MAG TPA: sugar phosphate isomerase/epimerase family protein [Pseudonocardiaceae bacterium]|nr:sugar phosphate isomerase/epimerase family protein [Pseudonocardiaceae bacterium]